MKKLIIKSLIAITTFGLVTACSDFLDQEVPGKLSENDFYKTDEDATLAVTAVYDMMSAHYNTSWASMYMVKTLLSDETNAGGSNDGDQIGYQNLDDFNTDAQNDKVRDTWGKCYIAIYRANKVINKVAGSTDLQKRLIAEAKVLRAYNYFDLVSLWGDVPIVLTDVSASDYTKTARASKANVYAQIEKDLEEAIPVLPVKSVYSQEDKFRASKGMAQALLGKVHLYQEEWPAAVAQFEAVITSGEYGLEPSIDAVFSKTGEFGIESLFELSFISTEAYDWGNFPWDGQPESNIHVQLMGPRSDYYKQAPSDSLIGGWGMNVAKKKIYDAFNAAGDANRKRVSIMSVAELKAAGGDWTVTNAWDFEGYWQRKYGSFDNQTGTPVGELNYGTNFRLIRYADVLLMAAEAHFRNNNENKTREYLNAIRQRPGTALPTVNATGSALFEAIVTERQLELAFEGVRFLDLVRWGRASQELGPLGFIQGKHEVLPIPINDVRTAGLIQNPNY